MELKQVDARVPFLLWMPPPPQPRRPNIPDDDDDDDDDENEEEKEEEENGFKNREDENNFPIPPAPPLRINDCIIVAFFIPLLLMPAVEK